MNKPPRQPRPHIHDLIACPASEATKLPAPPSHPAFQSPNPLPVWKCDVKYCDYETWSVEWFRR